MKLKHSVRTFERDTGEQAYSVEIPSDRAEKLPEIMAWETPEDAIYEYRLTPEQISAMEQLTGKCFRDPAHTYVLSCSAV